MPGKRPVKKGSFGSHFDELVKNFPHDEPEAKADGEDKANSLDHRNVHDRLFESAWARAREHRHHRPARNS